MDCFPFLRNLKMFRDLEDGEVGLLSEMGAELIFHEGEFIFRERDAAEGFYIVVSGVVDVFKGTGLSASRLARLREGELLGELSIFDNGPRSASAQARIYPELRVLFFRKDKFLNFLRVHPGVGVKILTAFLRAVSERLRRADEELKGLAGTLYFSGNASYAD